MSRDPMQNPVTEVLNALQSTGENRNEVNFWAPLAHLTTECLESRDAARISQSELAERMQTKQSVISRFENMGEFVSQVTDSSSGFQRRSDTRRG